MRTAFATSGHRGDKPAVCGEVHVVLPRLMIVTSREVYVPVGHEDDCSGSTGYVRLRLRGDFGSLDGESEGIPALVCVGDDVCIYIPLEALEIGE